MEENEKKPADGDSGNQAGVTGPIAVPAGGTKRGPGRPRKDGSPPRSKQETKDASGSDTGDRPIDPGLIGDLGVAIFKTGDELFVVTILSRARRKLPPKHYHEFRGEVDRIRLGANDEKMIREAFVALALKYPFLLKWGPEITLAIVSAQYVLRMANLLRHVNALPDYKEPPAESVDAKPVGVA